VGVAVHPTRNVLYTVNSAGEQLSSVDPDAAAADAGSSVRAFRIDPATGAPTALGDPAPAGGPVALAIHPSGEVLYVANFATDTLGGYSIASGGELTPLGALPVGNGPVGVAIHPSGDFLFLVHHRSDELMLFELAADGVPTLLQSLPTAASPLDVVVDADGDAVYVSQSGARELATYAFDAVSKSLVLERSEPTSGRPFQLALDPLDDQLHATHLDTGELATYARGAGDLELADRRHTRGVAAGIAIVSGPTARVRTSPVTWAVSALHEVETLSVGELGVLADRARPLPAGEEPDGLTLHPFGHTLYVVGAASGDVSTFAVDPQTYDLAAVGAPVFVGRDAGGFVVEPRGLWAYAAVEGGLQTFALGPNGVPEPRQLVPAGTRLDDLVLHPGGRYVYALDRASEELLAFSVHPLSGLLSPAPAGPFPVPNGAGAGALAIHPTGRFLLLTDGTLDTVTCFTVDPETGALSDRQATPAGSGPGALALHPSGDLLLVAHAASGNVLAYTLDASNGALALLDALTVGREPGALAFEASGRSAYVANGGSDSITVLDLGWDPGQRGNFDLDLGATLSLAAGVAPRGLLSAWSWQAR
jgi:6-phosphogluconolactonase (cycloisomerase 2 family)